MRVIVAAICLLSATANDTYAQLIKLTPEITGRIEALSRAAREKNPTSPNEAVYTFTASFNGEFGDIRPSATQVLSRKDIEILIVTPIQSAYLQAVVALRNLEPIPTTFGAAKFVSINVRVMQTTAPNVTKMVLFSNDVEVQPELSALKPFEFRNGFGQQFTRMQGFMAWRPETFEAGPLKLVVITDSGTPIEWSYKLGDLK